MARDEVNGVITADVAMNIFAKPYQTALSLLSLLEHSGSRIRRLWLQFEPFGSKYDSADPYAITRYLREKGSDIVVSQPRQWLAREPVGEEILRDPEKRRGIRYWDAFVNSDADFLFVSHNDVFIYKDIVGALLENIGDAFVIGSLGQCWNCPASKKELMRDVLNRESCTPGAYLDFLPTSEELRRLYAAARERGIFARPYDEDNFSGEFAENPWPLPECRVNEWACLVNLKKTRPLTFPRGPAWPFGAFRAYANHNLDTGSAWFRDLHREGLRAKNFDIKPYLKHWVGTGAKSPGKYAKAEDNAKRLLEKYYPDFIAWARSHAFEKA